MEETWELVGLVVSNKVNYRASNTRLRYQLVLSALVFCLGATYGVKELKIPGVLTFESSPNTTVILCAVLGFSIFTLFSFGVQHSLYRLEDPDERKEINQYRRSVNEDMSSIKSHFNNAKRMLGRCIEAYSKLPEEEHNRILFLDEEPKPIDAKTLEVRELTIELGSIVTHAEKIKGKQFVWEELFAGKSAPNKTFSAACIDVLAGFRNLNSSLVDRRIDADKIGPEFNVLSNLISTLEEHHKKFQTTLKSFSDARWLDRRGLPFLIPLAVWAILIGVGALNLNAKFTETNNPQVQQQTVADEMVEP